MITHQNEWQIIKESDALIFEAPYYAEVKAVKRIIIVDLFNSKSFELKTKERDAHLALYWLHGYASFSSGDIIKKNIAKGDFLFLPYPLTLCLNLQDEGSKFFGVELLHHGRDSELNTPLLVKEDQFFHYCVSDEYSERFIEGGLKLPRLNDIKIVTLDSRMDGSTKEDVRAKEMLAKSRSAYCMYVMNGHAMYELGHEIFPLEPEAVFTIPPHLEHGPKAVTEPPFTFLCFCIQG